MKKHWIFLTSLFGTSVVALSIWGVNVHNRYQSTTAEASFVGGGSTISEILNGPIKTDAIVDGTFTGSTPAPKDSSGVEYTDFSFNVSKTLYGSASESITIHQTGGPDFQVSDDPLFKVGDSYILFLHQYSPGKYFVVGGPDSRFQVQNGKIMSFNEHKLGNGASDSSFISLIQQAASTLKK